MKPPKALKKDEMQGKESRPTEAYSLIRRGGSDELDIAGRFFKRFLPLLLILATFSACQAVDDAKTSVNNVKDKVVETKDKVVETAEDIENAKDAINAIVE